jgi:F-type H+-transporting ATPase subunit b
MIDHLLHDPIFFYAVAYVLFLIVAWIYLRKPGLQWVDNEIDKIRDELDQARKLRVEAEAALAACAAKKQAVLAEAEAIIKHAKEEAGRLQAEAEAGLKYVLARHEQHALETIRRMEQEAVAALRTAVIDQAVASVRKTLADRMDETVISKLTDQAIADMPRPASTNNKPKAA